MEFIKLHLGLILVIVGVVGEGIEIVWKLIVRKRSQKTDLILDLLGAFFWIVLVIGLALEIPDAARTDEQAAQANKIAGQANERASSNEVHVATLTADNLILQSNVNATALELVNANIKLAKIKNAIPPRQIDEKKRELFITTLLQTNALSSPKIDIKVFAPDVDDPEVKYFAKLIREMLNDAGYGTNREEIIKIQPLNLVGGTNERMPQLFVIFATDNNGNKIPLSMPGFGGCIMPFVPSKATVQTELTNSQIPIACYFSTNPNDILGGVRNIFNYIGVSTSELYGTSILKPFEVGFYIPQQVQ